MRASGKYIRAFDAQFEFASRRDDFYIDGERWIVRDSFFDFDKAVAGVIHADLRFVNLIGRDGRFDVAVWIKNERSDAIAFGAERFKFHGQAKFAEHLIVRKNRDVF